MKTIILDPGHGGDQDLLGSKANQVVGYNGLLEKQLTLAVAKETESMLKGLYHVVLTRDSDINLSAADRALYSKRNEADIFVSLHFNGSNNTQEQGCEALVQSNAHGDFQGSDPKSVQLAKALSDATAAHLTVPNRGVKPGRWSVLSARLHHSTCARCQLEICFLSEPTQADQLKASSQIQLIASAIVTGIHQYFASLQKQQQQPKPLPFQQQAVMGGARAFTYDPSSHDQWYDDYSDNDSYSDQASTAMTSSNVVALARPALQDITHAGSYRLVYDRLSKLGVIESLPGRDRRKFNGTAELQTALDTWAAYLPKVISEPKYILTGGLLANRKTSQHYLGRAIDVDGFWWSENNKFLAINAPQNWEQYLKIQATLHKAFGTVLNYDFNADHHDHWHCDISRSTDWRQAKTQILFAQRVLKEIYGENIGVDGRWGTESRAAAKRHGYDIESEGGWDSFLDNVIEGTTTAMALQSAQLQEITHAGNYRLAYDRLGKLGDIESAPARDRRKFKGTQALQDALNSWATYIPTLMPEPSYILTGGLYVNKPGQHGQGNAIDVDGFWWNDNEKFLAVNAPQDWFTYLRIDASLRKSFGTVLNYDYNTAHHDHWHCDNGGGTGWRGVKSQALFAQRALKEIWQEPLTVDGRWGEQSKAAASRQGYNIGQGDEWNHFLNDIINAKSTFT